MSADAKPLFLDQDSLSVDYLTLCTEKIVVDSTGMPLLWIETPENSCFGDAVERYRSVHTPARCCTCPHRTKCESAIDAIVDAMPGFGASLSLYQNRDELSEAHSRHASRLFKSEARIASSWSGFDAVKERASLGAQERFFRLHRPRVVRICQPNRSKSAEPELRTIERVRRHAEERVPGFLARLKALDRSEMDRVVQWNIDGLDTLETFIGDWVACRMVARLYGHKHMAPEHFMQFCGGRSETKPVKLAKFQRADARVRIAQIEYVNFLLSGALQRGPEAS
jgi:hypothetical protein